jgi:hypothetical protein
MFLAAAAVAGGLSIFGFQIGVPVIIAFIIGFLVGRKLS